MWPMRFASRALAASLLSIACHTGYQEVNGKWTFVTWDEGNGSRAHELDADRATFQVVKSGTYAKDKNRVYYKWNVMDAKRSYAFSFPERELPARRQRRDAAAR